MPHGVASESVSAAGTAESLTGASVTTASRRSFFALIGLVAIPVVGLDQITKFYIRDHFRLYEGITVVRNFADITYTQNAGAAFSLLMNAPAWFRSWVLFALSAAAIGVILLMLARGGGGKLNSLALALILAGAAGNLIDRMSRGVVTDFIHLHYYAYSWPIFNVADSAITIGAALIIAHSIFGRGRGSD